MSALEKAATYRPSFPAAKTEREIELEKILRELVTLKDQKDSFDAEIRRVQSLGHEISADAKARKDSYLRKKAKAWEDARRILQA